MDITDPEGEFALSYGPDVILQCHEGHFLNLDENDPDGVSQSLESYASYPLSRIWDERKLDGPPVGVYKPFILDTIHGENDRCKFISSSLLTLYSLPHR